MIRNLPNDVIMIDFAYGNLHASGKFLADGSNKPLVITLKAKDDKPGGHKAKLPAPP